MVTPILTTKLHIPPSGQLTELRAADLRFTPDEAAAFLNDVMGFGAIDRGHRCPGCPRGIVPYLLGHSAAFCSAVGLIGKASLCVLMRPPDQSPPVEQPDEPQPFELFARSFGPDEALAHRLLDQVAGWDAAGRPSIEGLRLRSYPPDSDYIPSASGLAIQKQWSRLVLDWR